ncbi:MAG TPA: hypothetical protein VEJ63_00300 [Planctomycetota bacterium]|nr:hypothetical protein [Planctomycetota bacterium]
MTTPETNGRKLIGQARLPVQFGEQVIVSILYNHDANPVHHRPDHAIQWMLGLLAAQGVGGSEGGLEKASSEERTYTLGTRLLARQDVVVMPGIVLAAMCYERFVPPTELTVSMTTTFTYPLLVPTKGSVEVQVDAYEVPPGATPSPVSGARHLQIEAFGPNITGTVTKLMRIEALTFPAGTSADEVYSKIVAPQFAEMEKNAAKLPGLPSLAHPSSISQEDCRRYSRIVEPGFVKTHPITESAWQVKIPRVLTEVIEHLRYNDTYQNEVRAYHSGRSDEAERREAIKRYVEKEVKYGWLESGKVAERVEELGQMAQHLYARQHTVFDPRKFRQGGAATFPARQMVLDLHLTEMRLRRGIHRLFTRGRFNDDNVFMGEAMVTSQPLVTKELANFLSEINHSFKTLQLLQYKR